MKSASELVSATPDSRGKLISIFVGAVLLPSAALSLLTFNSVPKNAESLKRSMQNQTELNLKWVEKDLEMAAQAKALDAARIVGTDRLLVGHPEVVETVLEEAGLGGMFSTLRLEASSPVAGLSAVLETRQRDMDILRDALTATDVPASADEGEDSLPLTAPGGERIGVLRFQYTCQYAHHTLIREFFEKAFENPSHSWVIRVSEGDGKPVYENAPTPDGRFEVKRLMTVASFRGLKLEMRYKDRSIEEDVKRNALGQMALIGFIDVILGAGLFMVYSNVQRELHLSRLKSDFVANVSHELKTPLALIRLFAETLELGRVQSQEKATQYYRVINKESQRLTQLINNILDFSRIEAGRKEYRFAPTDVGRIVNEVVDAYRFQIEQQGFALELDVPEGLPEIQVDKEAVGQALINLVNNAIKYSQDDKQIRIAVREENGKILLDVIDHGIGIPKNEQKRIFEKFYRAENSLVHDTKGSGLGLALVRHIMDAHGGSVEVESAPGKGSTFTLALPMAPRA